MRQLRYWQIFNSSPETFSVCMVPKIARSGAEEMAQELRALAVHSKDLVWSPAHSSNASGEDLITAQHQNLHPTSGWLSRTEIQLERCWLPTGRSATAAPLGYYAVFVAVLIRVSLGRTLGCVPLLEAGVEPSGTVKATPRGRGFQGSYRSGLLGPEVSSV